MRRREVLAGIGAAGLLPGLSWADILSPAFLSAALHPNGHYCLCGLDGAGQVVFDIPLPDRGHAAAAHPTRPEAVAFARRPGRFAVVLDCTSGQELARLTPPDDRHFYGHGVFSADGARLFTTENDLETLQGRIGIWDAANGYARIGDIASGGIGPHDITRLPGTDRLIVANGGIETHPDSGRTPLNLATMRSNLAYLDVETGPVEIIELDMSLRQNSIRHLSVRPDGMVAAGMQWNGPDGEFPPLVMLHALGTDPVLLEAPAGPHRGLRDYVGSISFSGDGTTLGIASPRGSTLQVFDARSGAYLESRPIDDVCGLAPSGTGFFVSSGMGLAGPLPSDAPLATSDWQWDNHLIPVS